MRKYSNWAIFFILAGILYLGIVWMIGGFSEPNIFLGTLFLFIGVILSFIAIIKKEQGSVKYIALTTFFIILFLITWFEPIQIVRIMMWIKNSI